MYTYFSVSGEEPPKFLRSFFLFKESSEHFFLMSGQLPQEAYAVISWFKGFSIGFNCFHYGDD